jgi:hypothetical protein
MGKVAKIGLIAVVALVMIAIVFRVGFARKIVTGA